MQAEKPWWRQNPPWPLWFKLIMLVSLLGSWATFYAIGHSAGYEEAMAEAFDAVCRGFSLGAGVTPPGC